MTSAISVKDRLKNRAVSCGKTFQETLTAYGLERTIYRLSVSEYVERLADRYDLDGTELKEAISETFEHRGTGFDDIVAFTDSFMRSEIHQNRWKAFLKKKKALVNAELEDVVHLLENLLLPIVESINGNMDYQAKWNHEIRSWK